MHDYGLARIRLLFPAAAPLALGVLLLAGCGSTVNPPKPRRTTTSSQTTGSALVIVAHAPVAGVVSFSTVIQSIDAIDAGGKSVSLISDTISGTPTVDLARCNGLPTVLDLNDLPAGTYTQIAVTFGSATIGYLQAQSESAQPGSAPSFRTMPAVFTTSTVTDTLATPLVVAQTGRVGVRLDFRLDKSILVDGNGHVTGQVSPTIEIKAVGPGNPPQLH